MRFIDNDQRDYPLTGNNLTIGRAPGNDILIADTRVSARHAALAFERGSYVLTDLDSTNGTFVNRKRLSGAHTLVDNDEISFGGFTVRFKADIAPTQFFDPARDYAPMPANAPDRRQDLPPPQVSPRQNEAPLQVSEAERAAARMKSYTGSAVIVFVLYIFFFLPGLIVNYIYYKEAKRMQQIAGQSLPGQGCLGFMLWLNVIFLVLGLFVAVLAVLAGL